MSKITAYSPDTSPSLDDLVVTVDIGNGNKKVTLQDIADAISPTIGATLVQDGGWVNEPELPDVITYNGNRSYDLTFNATDLTDTISEGMKLRLTRTISAPTQCTDLEASSSQYYMATSASLAGVTFTTAFTAMAWVKFESYGASGGVITRRPAGLASGWDFVVGSSGQLQITGLNGANYRQALSYESIPIGKWVHIAGSVNMTSGTLNLYINGILVPNATTNSGSPATIVQSGDMFIGAATGPTSYFDGKIAQVGLFSAELSAATIRSYMSQGLSGSETNIVSAYSLSNTILDLNTTNNNDMTAFNSAVATNVDSPFGNYLGGTLEYGIITKTAFSTNTTLTVQVPEGCALPTSGGVSAVAYSTQDTPYRFPKEKEKWRVSAEFRIDLAQASPVSGTYYDVNARLTFPLGSWVEGYEGTAIVLNGTNSPNVTVSLSTSASALTDNRFTGKMSNGVSTANNNQLGYITRSHPVTETSATLKYLILASGTASSTSIGFRGTSDNSTTIIYADLAYL